MHPLDLFIPFGAFAIFAIAIVSLIVIGVTCYEIVMWLLNRDWDDERFE